MLISMSIQPIREKQRVDPAHQLHPHGDHGDRGRAPGLVMMSASTTQPRSLLSGRVPETSAHLSLYGGGTAGSPIRAANPTGDESGHDRRSTSAMEDPDETEGSAIPVDPLAPASIPAWRVLLSDPCLARLHHTCTAAHGGQLLYVVGGLARPGGPPLSDVVAVELRGGQDGITAVVRAVPGPAPPPRSHHAAALLSRRWLLVLGGWDGARRTADAFLLDTESEGAGWRTLSEEPGSEPPAGLSGHSLTVVREPAGRADGRAELVVLGREGGVRTQRRHGCLYRVHLHPGRGTLRYEPLPALVASRSGHSATMAREPSRGGHRLLAYGGRDSRELEVVARWPARGPGSLELGSLPESVSSEDGALERYLWAIAAPSRGPPRALRLHAMTPLGPRIALLSGGEESFSCVSSPSRRATNLRLHLLDTSRTEWRTLQAAALERSVHCMCVLGGHVLAVGGLPSRGGHPCPELCILELSPGLPEA
ncbi:unnamed protein product [Lampetra planeri]